MKVLINIPKKIYKHIKRPAGYITGNTTQDEALKSIVDGTPIPDNATNGDMIKVMFPNVIIIENTVMHIIYVQFEVGNSTRFNVDWWNALYKRGRENG